MPLTTNPQTPARGLERRHSPIDGTPYLTTKGAPTPILDDGACRRIQIVLGKQIHYYQRMPAGWVRSIRGAQGYIGHTVGVEPDDVVTALAMAIECGAEVNFPRVPE